MRPSPTVLSLAMLLAAPLAAQVVTIAIPCNHDNTLYEDPTGSLSNGQGTSLFVGLTNTGAKRRMLVQFDVTAIPPTARVLSAQLRLNVVSSAGAAPATITVHNAAQGWGEGASVAAGNGGNGAPAQPNDATWLHNVFPSSLWTTPGGSFLPLPSLTMTLPSSGLATSPTSALAAFDVEGWRQAPFSAVGWLLKMPDEVTPATARRIDSRESTTGPVPTLLVTYVMPGTVGYFGAGCQTGSGALTLTVVGGTTALTPVQLQNANGPSNSVGAIFIDGGLQLGGVPLGGGCSIFLTPTFLTGALIALDAAGAASTPVLLPSNAGWPLVVLQSAVLAPTALGFATSNAAFLVVQ